MLERKDETHPTSEDAILIHELNAKKANVLFRILSNNAH